MAATLQTSNFSVKKIQLSRKHNVSNFLAMTLAYKIMLVFSEGSRKNSHCLEILSYTNYVVWLFRKSAIMFTRITGKTKPW